MKTYLILLKRNIKLFFKDKGLFFTSLITPLILLVLYAVFLAKVYRDSIVQNFVGVTIPDELLNGLVGGQLVSSLLAVSCITVAFCSNMLMVQDKVSGARKDLLIAPVKRSVLALSYYVASAVSTLIICYVALGAGLIYIGATGWYLSFGDVAMLVLDVFVLSMFGTALSSVVNYFLSSQGQISAVGSIVSSCYGFICGAYMPIASFADGLQKAIMFLPGTYGTSLFRNHALAGPLRELMAKGYPTQAIEGLKAMTDCNIEFFGTQVSIGAMYGIVCATLLLLVGAYVLINVLSRKKKS